MADICGARNRQGKPCQRPAGWGTNHPGTGRCKLHGGRSPGVPGNRNAEKTGEHSRTINRTREFKRAMRKAPTEPTSMLEDRARHVYARLDYMYRKLLATEQAIEDLAAAGDQDAEKALVIIKTKHKQGLDAIGDHTNWTQTEAKSLFDRWLEQVEAINRVERLYARIAEQLKPKGDGPTAGGIGTLVINNNMPGVDDDPGEAADESAAK